MTLERLEESLRDFGFNEEEARIYIFLSRMGPSPAGLVSRRFSINRMKAYRTLKSLEERGLVHSIIGRPVRYAAVPVKNVLDRRINEMRERLSGLEEDHKRILEDWVKLSVEVSEPSQGPRFRVYQGRQRIYNLLAQMLSRAVDEVDIVATPRDLVRMSLWGIDDELREIASSGIRVRILTQVEEHDYEDLEGYMDLDVHHVIFPAPIRSVTVDNGETLTTVAMDDSMSMTTKDDSGFWTDAPGFVASMRIFFDALWSTTTGASVIIRSLRTGVAPEEIRVIKSREEYLQTFGEMVDRSESTIDLMERRVEEIHLTFEDLKALSDRGVKTRILTQVDSISLAEGRHLGEVASIMHSSMPSYLELLIVDQRETLMNIPRSASPSQAVWSNMDAYVETMNNVFQDYWSGGLPIQQVFSDISERESFQESLEKVVRSLESAGLQVDIPGQIVGGSGAVHFFSLAARSPGLEGRPLGIDILIKGDAFSQIIKRGSRIKDLRDAVLLIGSMKQFSEEEEGLAKLYGMRLIYARDEEELGSKILEEVTGNISP
jgi:sugar-specific transcriptional regulator TrmB